MAVFVGNLTHLHRQSEKQVVAATEKLKAYSFDFIASSPLEESAQHDHALLESN